MARLQEVKSLKDLGFDVQSPMEIPIQSLRSMILEEVYNNHIPVEITFHKERVKCYLLGYDPRFRDEVYQDIMDKDRFFIIPGRSVTKMVVLPKHRGDIIKVAMQRWMDATNINTESESKDGITE